MTTPLRQEILSYLEYHNELNEYNKIYYTNSPYGECKRTTKSLLNLLKKNKDDLHVEILSLELFNMIYEGDEILNELSEARDKALIEAAVNTFDALELIISQFSNKDISNSVVEFSLEKLKKLLEGESADD